MRRRQLGRFRLSSGSRLAASPTGAERGVCRLLVTVCLAGATQEQRNMNRPWSTKAYALEVVQGGGRATRRDPMCVGDGRWTGPGAQCPRRRLQRSGTVLAPRRGPWFASSGLVGTLRPKRNRGGPWRVRERQRPQTRPSLPLCRCSWQTGWRPLFGDGMREALARQSAMNQSNAVCFSVAAAHCRDTGDSTARRVSGKRLP